MAVAVVGFDIGGLTSYVAVARGGGIETITNEYSDRNTPTCVAFSGRQRLIGTSAKLQHVTNVKNTFTDFLPLVGKKFSDRMTKLERSYLSYDIQSSNSDRILVEVSNNDGQLLLTPEQLLAMQLTKLKSITEAALSSKVVDVVINVPGYYTDTERRALLDSSRIVGLNCVKLVNDLTAVATAYGLYNADLPPVDKPSKNVAFVSVGFTSTQVAVYAFNAGKAKVLSTASDPRLGGRDFDRIIFAKLANEFREKYKSQIANNPKACIRLLQECEKVKKNMSANSQELPVNIECLMNDHDLNCRIKREDFEVESKDLLDRFKSVLERCVSSSKLEPAEIHAVELVGGTSRIPALKNIVTTVFNQDGRTTLNADEAVARGCALQAAICSPAYKVREFTVTEACPYGITLHWDRDECGDQVSPSQTENDTEMTVGSKDTSLEVFPFLHNIPSSRRFLFNRRGPFTLEARYTNPLEVPNDNSVIGSFKIYDLPTSGELIKVRVKVRVNAHGVFSLSQAEYGEEYEKEVEVNEPEEPVIATEVKTPPNDGTPMDTGTPGNGDVQVDPPTTTEANTDTSQTSVTPPTNEKPAPKKKTIKKKAIRYKDLPVEPSIMQFSTQELNGFAELEGKLFEQDQLEHKRADAKNAVEEYVYEMRNKLNDQLQSFTTPGELDKFMRHLEETEDWLYGDGEDLHRQAYVDRLNVMKSTGDPIEMRSLEHKTRASAVQRFEQSLVHIRKVLDSIAQGEETYNHLTEEQLNQLQSALSQREQWLRDQMQIQSTKSLHEDPVIRIADITSQQKAMEAICHPIINTPKPAPPPPNPPPPTTEQDNVGNNNCPVSNGMNGKPGKTAKHPKANPEKAENMDVD